MTHYRRVGHVPPKRHTVHRDDTGARLLEELMGTEGFAGPSSLLYHRCSPSALLAVEPVAEPDGGRSALRPNHPVVPLHIRADAREPAIGDDLATSRRVLAGNDDLVLATATGAPGTGQLYRDAVGDELVFVREGSATLESVFGVLEVGPGDYVVVPAGTTHRWVVHDALRALVVEAAGHIGPPRKLLTSGGQFLEHAPYGERDQRAPAAVHVVDEPGPAHVLVRTRAGLTRHRYAHHPFDVVGWDGCVYPWALSIHEVEPIVGSLHQPPPVHQTFEGPGFVVCSFVPRPLDHHPDAVKVPYHHANVDSDEVLLYVDGAFTSRAGAGIEAGSVTIHPAGFVHGPQPGSWEASVDHDRTDETAVMVDTFRPLLLSPTAHEQADPAYLTSWSR